MDENYPIIEQRIIPDGEMKGQRCGKIHLDTPNRFMRITPADLNGLVCCVCEENYADLECVVCEKHPCYADYVETPVGVICLSCLQPFIEKTTEEYQDRGEQFNLRMEW